MYSGSCAAHALANVVTIKGFAKLSDHPVLVRYLKGIFNKHSPLDIRDINLVLAFYDRIDHTEELVFKYLVKKRYLTK